LNYKIKTAFLTSEGCSLLNRHSSRSIYRNRTHFIIWNFRLRVARIKCQLIRRLRKVDWDEDHPWAGAFGDELAGDCHLRDQLWLPCLCEQDEFYAKTHHRDDSHLYRRKKSLPIRKTLSLITLSLTPPPQLYNWESRVNSYLSSSALERKIRAEHPVKSATTPRIRARRVQGSPNACRSATSSNSVLTHSRAPRMSTTWIRRATQIFLIKSRNGSRIARRTKIKGPDLK